MLSGGVKNSWNWNFAIFRDLVLISSEAFYKKVFLMISQYSQENTCGRISF